MELSRKSESRVRGCERAREGAERERERESESKSERESRVRELKHRWNQKKKCL